MNNNPENSVLDPAAGLREPSERGRREVIYSISVSAVLGAIKVVAGIAGNSYALIADGIESLLDILSSIVVWGGLRIAALPPSAQRPFGHGKAEPLAALVVAIMLFTAAAGIAVQSFREIMVPHHGPAAFTLAILIIVVVVKELMFRRLNAAGALIQSTALKGDAWHQRSDALTSAAAFIGISIALIFGKGYESADDWAALFAAAIIMLNGLHLLRSALNELMDGAVPVEVVERLRSVAAAVPGVGQIEKCRVRKSGLGHFVEIHVQVDGDISVRHGHEIGHQVKDALMASDLLVMDALIHVEPVSEDRAEEGPPTLH